MLKKNYYDVIIVGSGVAGATLAKQLSLEKKKILLLEQGSHVKAGEGMRTAMSVLRNYQIGPSLQVAKGVAVGGSSLFYLAVADTKVLEHFKSLGIDLSSVLAEIRTEVPIAVLSDDLISSQSLVVAEAAAHIGLDWKKRQMLVDQSICRQGDAAESKWNTLGFLQQAVSLGAELRCQAKVDKVIVQDGVAVGVTYTEFKNNKPQQTYHVYAEKIILAAGASVSPALLQRTGISNVGDKGFYCDPCFFMCGFTEPRPSKISFAGCMGTDFEDGISYGDANFSVPMYKMIMLANKKFFRYFSHSRAIGVGAVIADEFGGSFSADGKFNKSLTRQELLKLDTARDVTLKILTHAGAKDIFSTKISAARVGGLVRINEHLDTRLQSNIKNLYVCDGSVLPEEIRLSPTLTILALATYLAKVIYA